MVALFLVFWGASIPFLTVAAPTYILTNSVGGFRFLTPSLAFVICRLFNDAARVLEGKWRKGLELGKLISPVMWKFPLNYLVSSTATPPSTVLCVQVPDPSASASSKRKPPTLSGWRRNSRMAMCSRKRVSESHASYTDFQPTLLFLAPFTPHHQKYLVPPIPELFKVLNIHWLPSP